MRILAPLAAALVALIGSPSPAAANMSIPFVVGPMAYLFHAVRLSSGGVLVAVIFVEAAFLLAREGLSAPRAVAAAAVANLISTLAGYIFFVMIVDVKGGTAVALLLVPLLFSSWTRTFLERAGHASPGRLKLAAGFLLLCIVALWASSTLLPVQMMMPKVEATDGRWYSNYDWWSRRHDPVAGMNDLSPALFFAALAAQLSVAFILNLFLEARILLWLLPPSRTLLATAFRMNLASLVLVLCAGYFMNLRFFSRHAEQLEGYVRP